MNWVCHYDGVSGLMNQVCHYDSIGKIRNRDELIKRLSDFFKACDKNDHENIGDLDKYLEEHLKLQRESEMLSFLPYIVTSDQHIDKAGNDVSNGTDDNMGRDNLYETVRINTTLDSIKNACLYTRLVVLKNKNLKTDLNAV